MTDAQTAGRPVTSDRQRRDGLTCVIIGGLEAACLLFAAVRGASVLQLLSVHLVALLALGGVVAVARRGGRDVSAPMLALLASIPSGPVGAIGGGLLPWRAGSFAIRDDLLVAWYTRISQATTVDPVKRLCDDIAAGRSINLGGPTPTSFPAVIDAGHLTDQQSVLGLVARRFHPDYLPILRSALLSPQPAVRVQAAAVAAHLTPVVRQAFREAIDTLPHASQSSDKALGLLARLDALTGSGLLDESDRKRGIDIGERLGDIVLANFDPKMLALYRTLDRPDAATQAAAMEKLLLARRRFRQLREFRSALSMSGKTGHWRIRRVPANDAAQRTDAA